MELYNYSTLLTPVWPIPASVGFACSTRRGGVSTGGYQGLNLGTHVGDFPDHVAQNRAELARALGVRPVFMEQVHGADSLEITASTPDGQVADVAWTSTPGLACTVMVADCLPILFCNDAGTRVAAAHAGWRGLLGVAGFGVVEQAVTCMGGAANQLSVWLGPCIGPEAFEVGDEVRAAFVAGQPGADIFFKRLAPLEQGNAGGAQATAGKWLADLPGLARQRLGALGIRKIDGNDGSKEWCTVSNPSRFFSHRRDRVSGRQAACIWLRQS